jgi:outer membrane protein OmpA-like peptidoglycan-associated protein
MRGQAGPDRSGLGHAVDPDRNRPDERAAESTRHHRNGVYLGGDPQGLRHRRPGRLLCLDSSTILSTDISPLNAVARCFTEGPLKGRSMRLVGHADPRGTAEYNMTLGQDRADSVQSYLDRHGVRSSQIATTSRGAIDASGHDAAGWATDRRVDVMLGS